MATKEKIYIGVEEPLILNDTDKFWMLVSGEVNVFYVRVDETGEYLCALKYLYSAKKGDLLFSLLSPDCKNDIRLVVFSNEANLLAINKHELINIDHFFLTSMIDKWIVKTSVKINSSTIPKAYNTLDSYNSFILNRNAIAYPSQGINWVNLIQGQLSVFAEQEAVNFDDSLKFSIPVCNKLWIKSVSEFSEIKLLSTREVLEDEINFLISLEKVQAYFYKQLCKSIEINSLLEDNTLNDKLMYQEEVLENTLEKIKSIVTGTKKKINHFTNKKKQSILYLTCQLIGEHAGFKFEEPKHFESEVNNTNNLLYAIAQSSKVRVRKVILRDVWWKDENGHLLAFLKEFNEPVALIQKNSTTYIIKNLSTGTAVVVDNEIAASLEPVGYMFFSGFDIKMDSIKKVLSFAMNGVKKDAKLLLAASLAGSLIGLLIPILSGMIYDDVIPTADKSIHLEIFTIMIIIALVSAGLQLTQGVLQMRVESKSSINLQAGVMDYILRLPVTFYKKYTAGDLTNRVLSINAIRQTLSNTLMTVVLSGAFSFVNLLLLFYYDSSLAWVGAGLALLAVAFMILMGWLKLKYDREVSKCEGEIQGLLFEFLSGISKIRVSGGEKRIFSLWGDKFSKLKKLGFSSGSYQNFVEVFNSSYPLFTSILFFSFIYYTVLNSPNSRVLSVGSFMAFIISFNKFLNDSLRLSMAFITSLNVIPLYERVKPILEEEPESIKDSIDPGELMGEIELNSISFRYYADQPLILKNVTFKIKPGEMVAFVGASGSGKSTIMRLLLGFETPELGSVFYDGNTFDAMNKELTRRQIGVVLQNGALMSGSIYQNIVGNSELTLEDAWEAARMAGMEEDIKNMPMEMHTYISEGAGTFSGGQRQRLMIARAIVHKPRLLFMDEATSALDNKTQNIVAESLDKLQATRIVIAHRLSTIKNADRIFVLDKGEIKESGTYEELIQKEGLFTELSKRQTA
ncbi:NHLP bacteriocin export ABC transporter permease/ATPase subunit [Flavobacterium hungaricum]|uniref:NHLP bacteriocin export ABC transporter permease/ATPase subunit n=1 Tax=Flavobacterium hungaricum TaxID=2082725 RepID=A0ABR9TM51_9FLAO|nr:NHLP bacteriocin export ABC transporter permease/ATPase subunit [Flavobacterium hungaricum]MBE8726452.1 NHLP bacteriocin export ABC transporter permease/ATPase subunit [Flavobacterium hungaricum]